MKRLSEFIVKKRNIILVIAVLLLIPSAIGYARTKVNYDLLSYLPSDAESMIAQTSLSDDFELASIGMLVVEHMPDKNVAKLKEEIKQIDGVKDVLWRGDVIDLSIPKEILPKDVKEMLYSKESTLMVIKKILLHKERWMPFKKSKDMLIRNAIWEAFPLLPKIPRI